MRILIIMWLLTATVWSQSLGAWISPDWFLPGGHRYTEAEVRNTARRVLSRLSHAGINMVFLETFLRGYSIAPAVSVTHHQARRESWLPVYPHLDWGMRPHGDVIYDTLQIFIEEGRQLGIEVHAWTHMFYWKMDNVGAMLPWHSAPSLWSRMMVDYLRREAAELRQRKEAAPDTVALMLEAADLLERTTEARELAAVLQRHHINDEGRPLGVLVRQAMRAGAPAPDFLLVNTAEDPFPAPRGKLLRPVYLNPASAQVRQTLVKVVSNLAQSHPGLAGVHLDHIRYPVDGQGLPEDLQIQDGSYNYYSQSDPDQLERYQRVTEQLSSRREHLRTLVDEIRAKVGPYKKLSSAVLPVYYRERDNGRYRLGGYDFSSQDWVGWKVDFVVPMLYEIHPYVIRNLLTLFDEEQGRRLGRPAIQVFPGVSQLRLARSGELASPGFVFFDLNLARDVKIEKKEETEDLNFGAQ